MKTQKNMMMALLLLIANVMIAQAINYPTYNSNQNPTTVHTTIAPAQSSQVFSGTYQSSNLTPMVDHNGIAVEPYSAAPGRPRRAPGGWDCDTQGHYDGNGDCECDVCREECGRGDGTHIGTGGVEIDPNKPIGTPIGSVLILLLLALMHVAYIAYSTSVRRQK